MYDVLVSSVCSVLYKVRRWLDKSVKIEFEREGGEAHRSFLNTGFYSRVILMLIDVKVRSRKSIFNFKTRDDFLPKFLLY